MRVLLASEPGVDGVFRHVEALAHFLIARGHHVSLAYSDVRGSDRLQALVAHVRSHGGSVANLGVSNTPGPRDLQALARLRRLVSSARPDVIHAHSSKAGALARALPFLGVFRPVFYTPHAYFGLAGGGGIKARVFNAVETVLGRIGATFVLSRGEQTFAEEVLHIPPSRLHLNPNPVDTARFKPASPDEKSALRARLGLPRDALLLGTVGRLAFQKDPLTLYRAFALASAEAPNLWLHHLGEGELDADCAQLARDLGIAARIIREPYRSEPLGFYQALDAMILTSRYEGLSLAVLEALACDLPVLLTEAPGNTDFLSAGLSHIWSGAKEHPESIAAAIGQWASDRAKPRRSNHRAIAQSRFSDEACFGRILSEYEHALGAKAAPAPQAEEPLPKALPAQLRAR